MSVEGHNDRFVINDIVLKVPPTQISVSNQSVNYEWQTLRSRQTQRAKSGHSQINIAVNVVFVGEQALNEELRPLIAQLRLIPFCYVDNQYIRDSLFPGEKPLTGLERDSGGEETIVLAMRMAEIEVDPSTAPITARAVLHFSYFNYHPFTPFWLYKPSIDSIKTGSTTPTFEPTFFSSGTRGAWQHSPGVRGTSLQAEPWRIYYEQALKKTQPIPGGFNGEATLNFLEFRTVPAGQVRELEVELDILEALTAENPDPILRGFYGGVARGADIGAALLQAAQSTGVVGDVSEMSTLPNLDALLPILQETGPRWYAAAELQRQVDYSTIINREAVRALIERTRIEKKRAADFGEEQRQEAEASKFVSTGLSTDVSGIQMGIWKRVRGLSLNAEQGIVIVNLRLSLRNIMPFLPIVGQRYGTFQYLGSMDAVVDIDMMVRGDAANRAITQAYDLIEKNALHHKFLGQGLLGVRIQNDFLKLLGLEHFITQDHSSDTIPGEPGTYAVSLRLVESAAGFADTLDIESLKPEFLQSDPEIHAEIIRRIQKYIIWNPTEHRFERKGDLDPDRNAMMAELVRKKLLPAMTKFADGVTDSSLSISTPFFAATEKDVPGITLIQRAVSDQMGDKDIRWSISLPSGSMNVIRAQRLLAADDLAGIAEYRRDRARLARERKQIPTLSEVQARERQLARIRSTGLSENTIENLAELSVDKDFEQTFEYMKRHPAVQKWFEVVREIGNEVMATSFFNAPEFSDLYKKAAEGGAGKGLPAYRDLYLDKVAHAMGVRELSLDPDFYLYSPITDSTEAFLDPLTLAEARRVALESQSSAQKNIEEWVRDSWLDFFLPDTAAKMIKAARGNQVEDTSVTAPPDVSGSARWSNGLYSAGGQEMTGIGLDSKSYVAQGGDMVLRAPYQITHTADIPELLGGRTAASVGTIAPVATSASTAGIPDSPEIPNTAGTIFAGGESLAFPLGRLELRLGGRTSGSDAQRTQAPHHVVNGRLQRGERLENGQTRDHKGTDLAAPENWPVHAIASGKVVEAGWGNGLGYRVTIEHAGRTFSKYAHMQEPPNRTGQQRPRDLPGIVKRGEKVRKGQQIGKVGRTDVFDSATHLHLEMRQGGRLGTPLQPERFLAIARADTRVAASRSSPEAEGPRMGPGSGGINVLEASLNAFTDSLRSGQAMRMVRAYPTFKLYFIEDDSEDRRRFGIDDFFSYNAIKSIRVVRDEEVPADLLVLELTNVSGVLKNRKFRYEHNTHEDPNRREDTDTAKENPLKSLAIQEGIDVELRLGYGNDPDRLSTVFVGKIMEIEFNESEDLVTLVCQSYAIEMVQTIKGLNKPDKVNGWFTFKNQAYTHKLLERMLAEPEVVHFGRWERNASIDTNTQTFRHVLQNKWRLAPTPRDDNIFAPSSEAFDPKDLGLISTLGYAIYQKTIWDICQEMTLRHPGWIFSVVPYKDRFGPRMTAFFGLPGQLYFARDPALEERWGQREIRQELQRQSAEPEEQLAQLRSRRDPFDAAEVPRAFRDLAGSVGNTPHAQMLRAQSNLEELQRQAAELEEQLGRRQGIIRPFRSYHLVTSGHHILYNSIAASSTDSFNSVSVQWSPGGIDEAVMEFFRGGKFFHLSVDAGLPDEEKREAVVTDYINCTNELLARRYAHALLMKGLGKVYKGSIVIVGNPDVKPYDIVYCVDEYSHMVGPVEVSRVTHYFTQETGFITEITPKMFVTSNEWTNMTLADAMGVLVEGSARSLYLTGTSPRGGDITTVIKASGLTAGAAGLALGAGTFAVGAGLVLPAIGILGLGEFMRRKMVDTTNYLQPVIVHPLMQRGRPLSAGVPTRKINNTWTTRFGTWLKDGKEGFEILWEDIWDKITLAPSQGEFQRIWSGNVNDILPKF